MSYHRSNSCNSGLFSSAFSFYSPSPLCPPLHLPVLQYSFCWVGSSNLTQKHPPMFPLSPCPGQSTSPGTQQAARWASLAVWTRGLVRKEECVECKWTHTHAVSKNTPTHSHSKLKHTNSLLNETGWWGGGMTQLLLSVTVPLSSFIPPSAHSLCSSPGRMEGWTFTDRTQVRRICLPRGWRGEEGKVEGKERRV